MTSSCSFNHKNLPTGFALVEILIAITLGLVVLGGVLSILIPTTETWKNTAAIASMQDVEQVAHDRLGRNIRQSSLMACGGNQVADGVSTTNGNTLGTLAADATAQWAFSNINAPFRIYSSSTNPTSVFGTDFASKRLKSDGNDVGDIFYALAPDGLYTRIQNRINHSATSIALDSNDVEQGDLILVHDCLQPVIFRATSSGSPITYTTNFTGPDFPIDTVISRYQPTLFYLGELDSGRPGLFTRTISKTLSGTNLTTTDQAILSGVVNMRVEYGVDSDTTKAVGDTMYATQYLTAPQLATAGIPVSNAVTVRVTLMIESEQSLNGQSQTSLVFPAAADASSVNCITDTSPDTSACPSFIDYADKLHRVVSFVFNMPKQTAY